MILTYNSLGTSVEIPVPDTYNSIGIAMSGGMDSTLLLALMMPHLDLSKITAYTVDRRRSTDVVKRVLAHLGADIPVLPKEDPQLPTGVLRSVFVQARTEVDYFYTGTNKNPAWADDLPGGRKPVRYPDVSNGNVLMPFAKSLKTEILELYRQNDMLDLLALTYTCTENPDTPCNACFACHERTWAFDTLGMIDPVQP